MLSRQKLRNTINQLLHPIGARMVNAHWGPRGFAESFLKLRRQGITPDSIIDIGASDGSWTRECVSIFPNAKYLMIDALEENRPALEELCATHPNVSHWIGALGSGTSTLNFRVHGDQSSFFHSEYDSSGTVRELQVRTLDEVLRSKQSLKPALIKADVQGYELEVLRGGQDALGSTEFVLLEVSFRRAYENCPLAHEVISTLAAYGFRIYDLCTYSQRPHDGELFQSDILFARTDSSVFAYEGYS